MIGTHGSAAGIAMMPSESATSSGPAAISTPIGHLCSTRPITTGPMTAAALKARNRVPVSSGLAARSPCT